MEQVDYYEEEEGVQRCVHVIQISDNAFVRVMEYVDADEADEYAGPSFYVMQETDGHEVIDSNGNTLGDLVDYEIKEWEVLNLAKSHRIY